MKTPRGFHFAGVHAGLKPARKDFALVWSDAPCAGAACFTANKARSAPIIDAAPRLPATGLRAVLVNAGNANALTGAQGVRDVQALVTRAAEVLDAAPASIVTASTGVIGVPLPVGKLIDALPRLAANRTPDPLAAAEAIMTTDTRVKMASRALTIDGREITIAAICKGSGMIAPALATTIAVIVTDAAVSPEALDAALREAMAGSFNQLTVDGDMSTNDTVYALANGRAENRAITREDADYAAFAHALTALAADLAKQIAADGEGATKVLEVNVSGAPSAAVAADLAKAVASSSLVKAAIFGADPNWGRVLASVGARAGTQGYDVAPERAQVTIQAVCVYDGAPVAFDAALLKKKMREPEIAIEVALAGQGAGRGAAWGCDLSYDYVKINADYTSLIVQDDEGAVRKDDRLTNYSPAFKVSLLVEALSYISKLRGQRCVIKYGGAAMVQDALKRSFCEDVHLLRSVGVVPIIVHGGGPEISRALEKLGGKSEFVDGVRVTDAADLKVVEMVLTGSINTALVTLLNRREGVAVGVSGKDAALLKAKKLAPAGGRDLGQVGEITGVNHGLLELLLAQGYVPVISPVGIGDDGQSYNINADSAAAAVATALKAHKLIYLTDVPGILDPAGALVSEFKGATIAAWLEDGRLGGGMRVKARSLLDALAGGVEKVHVIDGRTPHSVIAELFTDRGIGTLVEM